MSSQSSSPPLDAPEGGINWVMLFYLGSVATIVPLELFYYVVKNVSACPDVVKKIVATFLNFGKTLNVKGEKKLSWMSVIMVPKSWFCHYYVMASSIGVASCLLLVGVYAFQVNPPQVLLSLLDTIATSHRQPTESSFLALLATAVFTFQVLSRLYESYCVSVFSPTAVMSIHIYLMGLAHYILAFISLLAHMPALAGIKAVVSVSNGEAWVAGGALAIYVAAKVVQHDALRRLGGLRKNKAAVTRYMVPRGGGFNFVSSPHMSAEIVIYASIALLVRSPSWCYVLVFVVVNQTCLALSTHRWYRATFKDYPLDRVGLIPYLL